MRTLLLLLLASPLIGAGLPSSVRLSDASLTPEWVLPAGSGRNCRMVVDPKERPWLGCKNRFLLGPTYAASYAAESSFQSLAWLPEGSLLAVSGEKVGAFELAAAMKKTTGRAGFRPLAVFPDRRVTLHQGAGNSVYILAAGETSTEVYLLARQGKEWARHKLFSTSKRVTAVGGDGKVTFVALQRKVIGLGPGEVQPLFEHPDSDITTLAYSPTLGLFYAADSGAGYLGSRYDREFLTAPGAQIRLAGNSLYVLPPGGGVLKLSGLQRFSEIDAQLAAAEELEQGEKKN
jgi:hypothetical protein